MRIRPAPRAVRIAISRCRPTPRQQHDGHIDAGDQQYEQHARRHDPQCLALLLAGNTQAQRHHAGSAALVGIRIGLTDISEHMVHVRLGLLGGQAWLQASDACNQWSPRAVRSSLGIRSGV